MPQEGDVDWALRLTKLVSVSDAARARVAECASSDVPIRRLHDVILAHKLELLRYVIKAVTRSLEHVSPDGAAALELVLKVRDRGWGALEGGRGWGAAVGCTFA